MIDIRKGQAPAPLERAAFGERFRAAFYDPAFRGEDSAIARMEAIAWDGYNKGVKHLSRKWPEKDTPTQIISCPLSG
jgi:hypothetical protein